MPVPTERKCSECSSTMLIVEKREGINEPNHDFAEYKCGSCNFRKLVRIKKIRRREFDFGGRSYFELWCDDKVFVEPEPHSVVNRPERLIATMALCLLHLLWKDVSIKGYELARQLEHVALRSGYLVEESIIDENIVEDESEQGSGTDGET